MSGVSEHVVIVGAGQGGLQAAMSLRTEGFTGRISLIGEEPGLPYQRPPLSKAYLKTGAADALTLRPAAFFEKHDITLVTGTRVDSIVRDTGHVLLGSKTLGYDHLILATGTRNLRPPIDGLEHALDLRTLEDAKRLRKELDRPRTCAVIGAGFIGLEFAAVARALGHKVTVAEAAQRPMARAVSSPIAARFAEMHLQMGTRLCFGQAVKEVDETGIHLPDGEKIDADLILLAAGVRPNVELAQAAGLPCDNGIVTDAQLQTADPAISALGDCAVFPDPRTGRLVRLESVQAATDHARTIAKRITHGTATPYAAVPWFWSDQSDLKLQIAGLAFPEDDCIECENGSVLRFDGDALTAAETINNPKVHMKARKILALQAPPGRDTLKRAGYDLTLI
ncbi:NAD(P)/FAD-dependent oxidoreductase [Flavimaricola marinus]|uniref:Rhodocoxin reductase n=1 Tax=Flavimaricola marinus TaxID=1819565 RepID=A0A238LJ02_9RHOB|nr:FAD-dependent oxidoreductase [Flavimaricola marinus]SMY08860.1 Rhodocoxin reductase [Flavimaricola marinus]